MGEARVSRKGSSGADKWHGVLRVGVNAGARMALAVAVARLAGTSSFAVYVALVTVEVLASTLLTAGWLTALGSIAPRLDADPAAALLRHGHRHALRIAACIAGVLASCAPLGPWFGVRFEVGLAFAGATGAWLASTAVATVLVTSFRSRAALIGQAAGYLPGFLALGVAWRVGCDPLVPLFLGLAGGQLAASCWMRTRLPMQGSGDPVAAHLNEVAAAGRVVLVGSVANSVCTRVQPFVLAAVGGPVAVGLFGAANTLVGPLRVVAGAVGDVLRPRLALHAGVRGDAARRRRLVRRTLLGLSGGGLLLIGLGVASGEAIGRGVFGARFGGIGTVFPAAALFVALAAVVHVLVVAMQTQSLRGATVATRARSWAAGVAVSLVGPACAVDGARGAFLSMAAGEVVFLLLASRFLAAPAPQTASPARS